MNSEITDQFGKLLITHCYDSGMKSIDFYLDVLKNGNINELNQIQTNFIKGLSESQIIELKYFVHRLLRGVLPGIIQMMEANDDLFQISYIDGNQKVNILDLHPFLLGEMNIEGGWIDRFSEFSEYNKENRP